ncbi:serine-rich protein-like [Pyrus ussuriensis x Pyrus communis]|uniref:Serine-rich protein-like n=1 Tax=Pyrus ussuriensis x Pyrus communis TaxID=2448454 RepID=A0A5N5HJ49_9ROSA|nr:flocculation protein FLO11-like [Pyrus x bretschneideri]KAB2626603.1 serine-rich protein-like [Pyrus ussuriensis x Pyrus communis]
MESYSSSSTTSSTTTYLSQTTQRTKDPLHSVRKSSSKPWKKPAVAPLPPTLPSVYKVDPINFRELVHSLTTAPEFLEPRSLQSVAPPPIDTNVSSLPNNVPSSQIENVSTAPNHVSSSSCSSAAPEISSSFSVIYKELSDTLELSPMPRHEKVQDSTVDSSCLRLNLRSPSSNHWVSWESSSLEDSTVL